MPSNAPLGPVSARVVFNGQGGYYASAEVVESSFGISTVNGSGLNVLESYESLREAFRDAFSLSRARSSSALDSAAFGPAVLQNVSSEGASINSAANPAKPGQKVIVWGTGLGAGLNADNLAPESGDLAVEVEIWVGGKAVTTKHYSGRSSCCAGIDQIIFDIPDDTPEGCYVPVQVRTGGKVVSNSVSMAVSKGATCSDQSNPLSEVFRAGGRLGLILANRVNGLLNPFKNGAREETIDFGLATFRRENGGMFAYNALFSLPAPGSCTVHAMRGDFLEGGIVPGFRSSGVELDAGATVSVGGGELGKGGTRALYYTGTLGGTPANFRKRSLPESAFEGPVAVRGGGGGAVGAFELEMTTTPTVRWRNRPDAGTVSRADGLTVSWDGADISGNVLIAGVNSNIPANASAVFVCTAVAGAATFVVPPYILQALPPSPNTAFIGHGFGYVLVGARPANGPTISVPGLDQMLPLAGAWSGSAVRFK